MHIVFSLGWSKKGSSSRRAFKSSETGALFSEYVKRIAGFMPCEAEYVSISGRERKPDAALWLCERSAKPASSEEIAKRLEELIHLGRRELRIVIGGPDGLSKEEINVLAPNFVWSFGLLTLPHELAAVVAGEQIYRACTVLRNLPYHLGH